MGALKNISLMINILLIVIGVKLLLFQSDDFNLIIFLSYYYYFFFRTREPKNVLTDFSEIFRDCGYWSFLHENYFLSDDVTSGYQLIYDFIVVILRRELLLNNIRYLFFTFSRKIDKGLKFILL